MKAIEFVKMMNEETQGNTDIAAPTWAAMRTLLEIAARIEQTEEADWVCKEVA